jgi:hypothetical protein
MASSHLEKLGPEASETLAPMETASLRALQSDDQRAILDLVDSLRRSNLDGVLSLPQLVVCGDQSSGKSSVLEAITEIPFPGRIIYALALRLKLFSVVPLCRLLSPE